MKRREHSAENITEPGGRQENSLNYLSFAWPDETIVAIEAKEDIQCRLALAQVRVRQLQFSQDWKRVGAHSIVARVTSSNEGDDTNREKFRVPIREKYTHLSDSDALRFRFPIAESVEGDVFFPTQ